MDVSITIMIMIARVADAPAAATLAVVTACLCLGDWDNLPAWLARFRLPVAPRGPAGEPANRQSRVGESGPGTARAQAQAGAQGIRNCITSDHGPLPGPCGRSRPAGRPRAPGPRRRPWAGRNQSVRKQAGPPAGGAPGCSPSCPRPSLARSLSLRLLPG